MVAKSPPAPPEFVVRNGHMQLRVVSINRFDAAPSRGCRTGYAPEFAVEIALGVKARGQHRFGDIRPCLEFAECPPDQSVGPESGDFCFGTRMNKSRM